MNIKQQTAKISNLITTKKEKDVRVNKDTSAEILKKITNLVEEIKINQSDVLEEIITCQIFLLNELFSFLTREYLITGENEIKHALVAQKQSLAAIKALKELKIPTKIKTSPLMTRAQLVQRLGADMSYNTYQQLINSEEYINANE